MRTVVGNMLPDDRDTPIRLPGRTGPPSLRTFFVCVTVMPVTILPMPTPYRALSFATYIRSGKRLLRRFVKTLLVVVITTLVPLWGSPFRLVPVRVEVPPTIVTVQIILRGTPLRLTEKQWTECRARVF